MPNVNDMFASYKKKNCQCDICRKPATFVLDKIPERTNRAFHFCDKCMKRNQHLLFNSGLEAQKFFATYLRRVNGEDLPPLHN